ncbi:MAG: hypothetical protein O2955_20035 [Planctomycetota bacterium]|nr:hypothetical protein [Planctomycetota bacterium]MDA1214804.1 hypothetical protein [Planctomycetota bacterium]
MDITRKTSLERELEIAKLKLNEWVKTLDAKGLETAAHRRDAVWRSLNAKCRQLKGRLRAVAGIEANDAEVARLKAEKLAAAAESVKAPKPEKAEKAGKAKAKAPKKAKT